MKVISQVLLAVFLGWLGAGCRSVAPVQPENLKALEIDGLTLSVYPLTTKQEVKQIFKVNLLNRGVLPIQVKAENHNQSNKSDECVPFSLRNQKRIDWRNDTVRFKIEPQP